MDEFAQKKGIDIDYTFESLSGAEYSSLLLMDLQSNEAPDAFWIMESDIKAFIGAGLCAKLNDALAKKGKIQAALFHGAGQIEPHCVQA